MKKHNYTLSIALLLVFAIAISGLTGCGVGAQVQNTSIAAEQTQSPAPVQPVSNVASVVQATPDSAHITNADTVTEWDDATSTKVNLDGTSILVNGSGATADGGTLTITKAGTYVISGTLTDGQIVVNATKNDKVRLVLSGVNITNLTGAPIYASGCDKLIVTLVDGTTNTLADGGVNFQYVNTTDEEPNAALFCKNDLTINGKGTLTVNAGFNNGIGAKDNLLIVSGNFVINAANHGLRGNDSVTVFDGSYSITAGNDGIQTNNTKDAAKGFILVEGGHFEITSAHDAMQADTTLTVTSGDFKVTAGGGYKKTESAASADTTSDSFKGFKATGDIQITGGTFVIDSYDDSIHSNGNIDIKGGEFTLSTGDDGVHADGDLTVSDDSVKITITASYEGLEAANITIMGGIIDVVSSDDGLNGAGGNDQNADGGRFGKDSFASAGNYSINISGGKVTINAGGDGIDSNGAINIRGGTVVSLINSLPDNGAMDCDGTFTLMGGNVIYGGTGTGSNPGESSTQSYVYVGSGVSSGSEVTVNKDGKPLITFTPSINCQSLVLSSPDIVSGQSYEVYSGGNLLTTATAGTGGGGMSVGGMGGGGQRGSGSPGGEPRGQGGLSGLKP